MRGADEFAVCLAITFVTLVVVPFEHEHARPVLAVFLSVILLFTLWTAAAPRALLGAAAVLALGGVVVVLTNEVSADERPARLVFSVFAVVCLASAIGAVVARISRHPRVTVRTATGALTVYLLLGLLFCYLFVFVSEVQQRSFFAQPSADFIVSYLYFSFSCLTTVGFGDLTAATDVGRMIAVVEALIGQLYLVTVVALVVGNFGRQRRAHGDDPEP